MFGLTDFVGRATLRAVSMAAVCALALSAGSAAAKAETRTLKMYNLHTKEKISIAYKKNGRYSSDGLKQINWFLRDWRRKEPTKMDTRLLDLIWEAYRQSGSRDYINVVCGYRAPATNNMLRSRSSGVAKESQHTQGRALDFFIPDVPLKKMREIGLKMQVGGVGYYPRSGSPFVHFDVGNARHWPRMSRKELVAVFPNGNTVHVPSDGKPLPGYEQALASYKARKGTSAIQVANAGSGKSSGGGKTLLAALFGGGADEEDDVADVETAAQEKAPAVKTRQPERAAPEPQAVEPSREAPVAVAAMVPTAKPNLLATGVPLPMRESYDTSAPVPPAGIAPAAAAGTEVAALDISRIPLPQAAPGRPTPATPAATANDAVSTLVAAMEQSPSGQEIAVGAPAQLAYAIPTPRERPPFESILKSTASADNAPTAASVDEVKRILESSPAMRADVAAQPTAPQLAANQPLKTKPAGNLLLAALETQHQTEPVMRSRPVAKIAVPAGKTGRFARKAAPAPAPQAPAPAARSQQAIDARIAMAALVADPEQRAVAAVTKKPKADVLVRDVPTSVFTAGFTAGPLNSSDRFAGSAVNFLPVAKFR